MVREVSGLRSSLRRYGATAGAQLWLVPTDLETAKAFAIAIAL